MKAHLLTRDGALRARVIPWDDAAFVRAFERARSEVLAAGLIINGPKAAAAVERRLHDSGYPSTRIDVERTVDEALLHRARWTVWRDGV